MKLITFLCASFFAANIFAADLMDAYNLARLNDPTFKSKKAEWLAAKQDISISRASLLPQLKADGSLTRTRSETDYGPEYDNTILNKSYYHNDTAYGLTLTQSVFNFNYWATVWKAKASAKAAHAAFIAAEQDLLFRVAQAYFGVVTSKSILKASTANKEANRRLFIQAKHKHDVGIIPVKDLEEARTKYDLAIAEEISNKNNLDNNIEKLTEITKVRFTSFAQLKGGAPLHSPNPASIDQWTKSAEKQNPTLLAARQTTIAAREEIKVQNAGHLPTISVQATHSYNFNDNYQGGGTDKLRSKSTAAKAAISIPLFQGGGVYASARKADYLYQKASADQEKTHREVVSQTRQSYLGVLSYISKIKADKQAIRSANSSLRANRASYSVGTSTMSDVLTAQSELFKAQKTYAEDEYNYMAQFLQLKALTGILNVKDLEQINSWFHKPGAKTNAKATAAKKIKKDSTKDITIVETKKMKKANIGPAAGITKKASLKNK